MQRMENDKLRLIDFYDKLDEFAAKKTRKPFDSAFWCVIFSNRAMKHKTFVKI